MNIPGMIYDPAWKTLREYPASGDGVACRVEICRMPAEFFRIVSNGEVLASTGSGMRQLGEDMAKAIADGMLVIHASEDWCEQSKECK